MLGKDGEAQLDALLGVVLIKLMVGASLPSALDQLCVCMPVFKACISPNFSPSPPRPPSLPFPV